MAVSTSEQQEEMQQLLKRATENERSEGEGDADRGEKRPVAAGAILKWGLVGILLIGVAATVAVNIPTLSKLLKNFALAAKVYGWAWMIGALLSCLLPGIGLAIKAMLNRNVSIKDSINNVDKVGEQLGAEAEKLSDAGIERIRERIEPYNEEGKEITEEEAAEIKDAAVEA